MNPERILIVEDEGLIAMDLKARVESAGYPVTGIVDNSKDARAAAAKERPDLVLMDIQIKGPTDGVATASLLQCEFDIPVIFVTAHADPNTVYRAKITGPLGYIVKPFINVDFGVQIEVALWKHAMERKLRISEAWMAATLGNVGDAIIATHIDGRIAAINHVAAQLTGWDAGQAKDKLLLEVFCAFEEKNGLPTISPLETLYKGEKIKSEPQVLLLKSRKGGDLRLIEATISENRDADKALGVIVVFRDITERRRAEKQARQLQSMQSIATLSAGLGKELGVVLGKIFSWVNRQRPSPELSAWMDHAIGIAQQMTWLGQTPLPERKSLNLNRFIQGLIPDLQPFFGKRTIELALQREIPPIEVDAKELKESLIRLASEIRKEGRRKGCVKITTKPNRDWSKVVLILQDWGKAGKESDGRSDVSIPKESGTSLPLVHYFMAMHGGKLTTTKDPEVGTTFEFTFPSLPGYIYVADEEKIVPLRASKAG